MHVGGREERQLVRFRVPSPGQLLSLCILVTMSEATGVTDCDGAQGASSDTCQDTATLLQGSLKVHNTSNEYPSEMTIFLLGEDAAVAQVASARSLTAVVLNLEKRPDRWASVQESFARNVPWLKVSRLDAVDGCKAPIPFSDVTQMWSTERMANLFDSYRTETIKMSLGERGCGSSHVKAWRLAANGTSPLIVLEDDAVAFPAFTRTLEQALIEAPPDTGAIWLNDGDRGTQTPLSKVLMSPSFLWSTSGYVIWPAAARALLRLLPMDMPVDNFMAWHIQNGALRAFSVRPAVVRQAQPLGVGSNIPHSDLLEVEICDTQRDEH